jgi:RNA polymerase sigma factor (sigma-70 family)
VEVAPEQLLEQYLAVRTDVEADRRLEEILQEVALPVIRRIVSSAVRHSSAIPDAEDIVADTLMDLLRWLRELRGEAAHPIHDLRRYIVSCAYNRCHERLRERFPERTRLRNQLRYLCGHHGELAIWRNAQGELVCGFREWSGRQAANGNCLEEVRLAARSDPAAENRVQVTALALALLHEADAPVTLDALVAAIARLIGLAPGKRAEVPLAGLQAAETAPDAALQARTSLRELWDDVRQLARNQRIALLLNLRDLHGRESLSLFPLTRTATIAEIAEAVGMAPERFAVLWNELPLSDAAIAELLEMTPRQVIKLRRLARERLRRMKKSRTDRNVARDLDSSPKGVTIAGRR